jgi:hypothetical protein
MAMDDDEKEDLIRVHTSASLRVGSPILPSPVFKLPFKTLQEWLVHLCNEQPPQKPISEYQFQLYYSSSGSLIAFYGQHYTIEDGVPTRRITFQPAHVFFPLPKNIYRRLTYSQLKETLYKELNEFTKTSEFKNSFLSKSFSINTGFGGEIWPDEQREI